MAKSVYNAPMAYRMTKAGEVFRVDKYGMHISVLPTVGDVGVVVADTETGHNQEFFHKTSTFHYVILEGGGSFFLDDAEVPVAKGDCISIPPGTRIYYRGAMRVLLMTNPPWRAEDEVETRATIW